MKHILFFLLVLGICQVRSATLDPNGGYDIIGDDCLFYPTLALGDVNGDGYSDFMVQVKKGNDIETVCYVVFGGPTASLETFNIANFTSKKGFKIVTPFNWSYLRISYADLDKDGFSDIIVGTTGPHDYRIPSRPDSRVFVVWGSSSPVDTNFTKEKIDEKVGFMIIAPKDTEFGHSLSAGGDVNGDGFPDIVIGEDTEKLGASAYVVYGGPRSSLKTFEIANMTSKQGFKIKCKYSKNVYNCGGVSFGGDVNGDGYADLLLTGYVGGINGRGVWVVYGSKTPQDFDLGSMTLEQGFNITDMARHLGGYPMRSRGDINKDGYADIVIAASHNQYTQSYVYVVYGGPSLQNTNVSNMTESQGFTISHNSGWGFYGGLAGDFNGDGYSDLLLGLGSSRQAYIYYGGSKHKSFYLKEMLPKQGLRVLAHDTYGEYLESASFIEDINKDGYSDVVLGMRGECFKEETDNGKGFAQVLFGRPSPK